MIACSLSLLHSAAAMSTAPGGKVRGGQPASEPPGCPTDSCPPSRVLRPATAVRGRVQRELWKRPGLLLSEVKASGERRPDCAPSRADADPSLTINALSCATTGNCAAVGSFEDTHSNGQSFVADGQRRVEGAQEVNLPSNAGASVQNSEVHSVDCWSPATAALSQLSRRHHAHGLRQGLEVNEVRGVWDGPKKRPATRHQRGPLR